MRYVDPHAPLIRPVRPRTPGMCEDRSWCYLDEAYL